MLRQIKVADLCKELEEKLVELQYSEDSMRRYCKVFQEFVEYAGDCDYSQSKAKRLSYLQKRSKNVFQDFQLS